MSAVVVGFDTAPRLACIRMKGIQMCADTLHGSEVLRCAGARLQGAVQQRLGFAFGVICYRDRVRGTVAVGHFCVGTAAICAVGRWWRGFTGTRQDSGQTIRQDLLGVECASYNEVVA